MNELARLDVARLNRAGIDKEHPNYKQLWNSFLSLRMISEPSSHGYVPCLGQDVVAIAERYQDGSTGLRGLDYFSLQEYIYPIFDTLSKELLGELEREEADIRIGHMAATAISQGQIFLDANKRTARAVFGLATNGRRGISAAYNGKAELNPTLAIEQLILRQNTARMMNPDNIHQIEPLAGVYVDDSVVAAIDESAHAINELSPPCKEDRLQPLNERRQVRLAKKLELFGFDSKSAAKIGTVILQRNYGAAVLAIAHTSDDSSTDRKRLLTPALDISQQLLQMRMSSLLTGLASGGTFVEIAGDDSAHTRHVVKHKWQPTFEFETS